MVYLDLRLPDRNTAAMYRTMVLMFGCWLSIPSAILPSNDENPISEIIKLLNDDETPCCCDMGQNDTIGKIELNPSFVLSSDNTNCKNDIQLFHQLFDELCVNRDYH